MSSFPVLGEAFGRDFIDESCVYIYIYVTHQKALIKVYKGYVQCIRDIFAQCVD